MPMMSKNPKKEKKARSVREIEEIIGTIEEYLQRTRETVDQIESIMADLEKEKSFQEEKTPAKEDPMKKYFSVPTM